jgi:choline dehydrogenase-like flavoprotein
MKIGTNIPAGTEPSTQAADFAQRVHVNQTKLASELKSHYDFIVCGSGSSGAVVARKLAALENFIRDSVLTYHHQTCTAKMGRDSMSVVDGHLKVYGIANLRIADASIMPRLTTGNTMAPCVVIGERAGEILKADHKL